MISHLSKFATIAVFAISALFIVGCASQRDAIPASATMLNDAHGDVTVTAPHNGTVYVYDKDDNKIVYSGKVNRDDVVKLDEQSGNIDINDRIAAGKTLNNDHDHQIFFDRNPHEAEQATYIENNGDSTVVTHDSNGTHETTVVPND